MKKSTRIWLITAGALVLSGIVIFVGAMAAVGWDFYTQDDTKLVTEEYEIADSFENLAIDVEEDDIVLLPSDDKNCKVVCSAQENASHTVEVKDHTLTISVADEGEWYKRTTLFSFGTPKVAVYLPQARYHALTVSGGTGDVDIPAAFSFKSIDITGTTGDVRCAASSVGATKISISTGDIRVEDAAAGEMDLHVSAGLISIRSVSCKGGVTAGVSTGDVFADQVVCESFSSEGTTGDITLTDAVAQQLISVVRSTGDVRLDGCDASQLFIKTSTGDVSGSLLSEKVFIIDTTTGDINVPKTTTGGKCEITTSTGDINISIK